MLTDVEDDLAPTKTWAKQVNMEMIRIDPNLAADYVDLDQIDNKKLINMLWKAECDMRSPDIKHASQKPKIKQVVDYLMPT